MGKRVFRNQHHHLDDVEAVQRAAGVAASARGVEIATPSAEPGAAMQEVNVRFIACRARGMPAEHDFKVRIMAHWFDMWLFYRPARQHLNSVSVHTSLSQEATTKKELQGQSMGMD